MQTLELGLSINISLFNLETELLFIHVAQNRIVIYARRISIDAIARSEFFYLLSSNKEEYQ